MLSKFSDEQREIVLCPPDRHAIVRAVAGSGKSTVLVERLAYLHEVHRVNPNQILAVMFNRDAALQLTERLHRRLGRNSSPQSITYHGLGTQLLSILMRNGKAPAWRFENSPDKAVRFVQNCLDALMDRHEVRRKRHTAEIFLGFVDRVKGDMVDAKTAFLRDENLNESLRWFIPAYDLYEKTRAQKGVRFFSDLIYDPLVAIKKDPEAAALIAGLYEHIVVDEYQDICESQQQLVNAVAGTRAKLMVVGDDDQTIYTWRGALPSYILHKFAEMYPNPIEYKLSRTWRYGHALSVAANHVICNNLVRAEKLCVSGNKARRTQLRMVLTNEQTGGSHEEKKGILLPEINAWLKRKGTQLNDIAVLFRTYGRSGQAQLELLNAGVPFRMAGPPNSVIFKNTWVEFLLGWLQLAAGDFGRHPFAGGEPDFGSIRQVTILVSPNWLDGFRWDQSRDLAKALLINPDASVTIPLYIQENRGLPQHLVSQLQSMAHVWNFVRGLGNNSRPAGRLPDDMAGVSFGNAASLFRFIYKRFQMKQVIQKKSANKSHAEDNALLVEALGKYIAMTGFGIEQALTHIQHLITFSERSLHALDAMTITSVHRSKGLEWDCVILPDLRQGWFPHVRGLRAGDTVSIEGEALEDERRLFYVAMTRACERLILMAPNDGMLDIQSSRGDSTPPTPLLHAQHASQFLYEMNYKLSCFVAMHLETNNFSSSDIRAFKDHALAERYLAELGVKVPPP